MSMKLVDNTPSFVLVDWACASLAQLKAPADRPWFQAPPPAFDAASWEYQCRCKREPVRVQRYRCAEGQGSVYLGQCRRCQTVIWTYRPGENGVGLEAE